jgi:glycosyltransferase involved in cell wall biosynthesis
MRVGLNATCFNGRASGANQRFRSIYGRLIRQRPDIRFLIYEPADYRVADWFAGVPNVIARRTPLPSEGRWARMAAGLRYWPGALREDGPDLFEMFSLPLVPAPCPTVLTIHDLRPIAIGGPVDRMVAATVLRHAFRHADRVVAVSDAVKAEILRFRTGTAVSTIYNGVDPAAFADPGAETVAAVRRRWNLPPAFVLTVGHLEARKNLPLLVDAIARLRDRGLDRPLVIVGRDGGQRGAIRRRIAAQGLGDRVTLIEEADDATVRALHVACTLVAVPSRYEGFGIGLIEAMAARRPLVTSDIPVFRELTGDRGRTFPVDDVETAAAVIERVWSDPVERARLIAEGERRVAAFGFDGPAGQLAALYEELVGRPIASAMRVRAAGNEWNRS